MDNMEQIIFIRDLMVEVALGDNWDGKSWFISLTNSNPYIEYYFEKLGVSGNNLVSITDLKKFCEQWETNEIQVTRTTENIQCYTPHQKEIWIMAMKSSISMLENYKSPLEKIKNRT